MPINTRELLIVASKLTEEQNMRVCIKESFKGGIIVGSCAVAGSMLLGPAGLAVGGVLGGLSASWMAKGKFKSVADIILNDLSPAQQAELGARLQNVVADLRIEDAALLLPVIMGNQLTIQAVLGIVTSYLQNDLHMVLTN